MADHADALQKAVYDALVAASLGVTVYDHVPANAAAPYVQIGDGDASDWGSKTFAGQSVGIAIHVWSEARGFKEANDLASSIHTALHEVALSLTGGTLVQLRFATSNRVNDPDGVTKHVAMRFEALIQGD